MAEYEKIRKAPRTKSDQKKIIKKAYDQYIKNIGKQLAGLLSACGPSAFDRLPHMQNNLANSYLPQEIFEAALDQLPPDPPNAMSDSQKKLKLDAIQKKMDEQKAKIKEFTPQAYIQMRNGNVQCDSRAEFVRFWQDKQAWIARPCNIQGIDLAHCSENEQWLYKHLKIGACILSKAVKLPYRP